MKKLIIILLIFTSCEQLEEFIRADYNLDIKPYTERINENDFINFNIGFPPNDHTNIINWYPIDSANVQFNHEYGNQLFLRTIKKDYNGRQYTSGSIMSDSLLYGKYTIIAKPPADLNGNAAIWLISPDCTDEIDFCEHTDKPNEFLITFHKDGKAITREHVRNTSTFRAYYKYEFERTEESIKYWINDQLIFNKPNIDYHKYMYLVINNALYYTPSDDELIFKIDCIIFEEN